MGLRVSDRARYARQLLLPQIGEIGQARLLTSMLVAPASADRGTLAVTRAYLERAGVRVVDAPVEGAEAEPLQSLPRGDDIARIAGRPELHEAARALVGALSALQAIQSVVRASPQPAFSIPVLSSEEP